MNNRAFVITLGLLILTLVGVFLLGFRPVPQVVNTNLENLPMNIGDYRGVEDSFSIAVYEELNADMHVYRHYTDPKGNRVSLYVGYYGTAKGGRTPHNPYACLPSAGWAILESYPVEVDTAIRPEAETGSYRLNYILAKNEDVYETVLHWYQSDKDRIFATGLQQNLQRFYGRLLHNRNDGAFVRVTASITENEIEDAKLRIRHFAEVIIPQLAEYWPEER